MAKIVSVANQTINDAVSGRRDAQVQVEIDSFCVQNNAQMTYGGQEYTGVTSIVPKFFIEYDNNGKTERVDLVQGLPQVFNYPSEIIEGWRAAEVASVQITSTFPARENEELAYVLRHIISTELTVPFFGLSRKADWTVDNGRSSGGK